MRRLAAFLLLAGALAAPSAAQAFGAAVPAGINCSKTVGVSVGDSGDRLFFSKAKVTIRKNACVRWTWTGVLEHRVVTPDGLRSARRRAPYTYRRGFIDPRVKPFRIFCSVHPTMRMKVRVLRRSGV